MFGCIAFCEGYTSMLWFELPNTQQTKNLNIGIIYEDVVYKQLLISCYICGKDVALSHLFILRISLPETSL